MACPAAGGEPAECLSESVFAVHLRDRRDVGEWCHSGNLLYRLLGVLADWFKLILTLANQRPLFNLLRFFMSLKLRRVFLMRPEKGERIQYVPHTLKALALSLQCVAMFREDWIERRRKSQVQPGPAQKGCFAPKWCLISHKRITQAFRDLRCRRYKQFAPSTASHFRNIRNSLSPPRETKAYIPYVDVPETVRPRSAAVGGEGSELHPEKSE